MNIITETESYMKEMGFTPTYKGGLRFRYTKGDNVITMFLHGTKCTRISYRLNSKHVSNKSLRFTKEMIIVLKNLLERGDPEKDV